MLQSMELERVGHDTETQQQQLLLIPLGVLQLKKKKKGFLNKQEIYKQKKRSLLFTLKPSASILRDSIV